MSLQHTAKPYLASTWLYHACRRSRRPAPSMESPLPGPKPGSSQAHGSNCLSRCLCNWPGRRLSGHTGLSGGTPILSLLRAAGAGGSARRGSSGGAARRGGAVAAAGQAACTGIIILPTALGGRAVGITACIAAGSAAAGVPAGRGVIQLAVQPRQRGAGARDERVSKGMCSAVTLNQQAEPFPPNPLALHVRSPPPLHPARTPAPAPLCTADGSSQLRRACIAIPRQQAERAGPEGQAAAVEAQAVEHGCCSD